MFGDAGRQCAEIVLRWAVTLFTVPLDVLNIRVVLAPIELGPYNRHAGYHYGPDGQGVFTLGNRHVVRLNRGTLVLVQDQWLSDDFIVHEQTHQRQAQLLREHGSEKDWKRKRGGVHRDRGWYRPSQRRVRDILVWNFRLRPGRPDCPLVGYPDLTEVQAAHWPESFRTLIVAGDPRLPGIT